MILDTIHQSIDRLPRRRALLAWAPALVLFGAAFAAAAPDARADDGALYTMTNAATGNEVLVFSRAEDTGALTLLTTVASGGKGSGDDLGNQGALALSEDNLWLIVVNAGDGTISSFSIQKDGLQLVDTIESGGLRPVSVDMHGDFIAVLNAGGTVGDKDKVKMFFLEEDGTFKKLRGFRYLSQDVTSPAQVEFVQEGHVLVVTEKDTGKLTTFPVRLTGHVGKGLEFDSGGPKPFGFTAVNRDHILVTDATLGTVAAYSVDRDGVVVPVGAPLNTTELATCWAVATPGFRFVYTTNTMSNSVTGVDVDFDANLALLNADGVTAPSAAGPIDAALCGDGRALYVLASGADAIEVYSVNVDDGTLTHVETETGLPDGANGLAVR
jgi:6-phosphogluconolactonase